MKLYIRYMAFALCTAISAEATARCTVAVASNFSATAKVLLTTFNRNQKQPLRLSSASTGKLYNQIIHGAPYCVFLAADTKRPQLLIAKGLADKGSNFIYATGQLALWSKNTKPSFEGLANTKKIALANPKLAPYGQAALQTLKQLNLFEPLKDRFVYGENINQTLQFIASQNAEVGFIAVAQILAMRASSNGHWVAVPQKSHAPLEQSAVLLQAGANNVPAVAFMRFLKSEQARIIIKKAGYIIKPQKNPTAKAF